MDVLQRQYHLEFEWHTKYAQHVEHWTLKIANFQANTNTVAEAQLEMQFIRLHNWQTKNGTYVPVDFIYLLEIIIIGIGIGIIIHMTFSRIHAYHVVFFHSSKNRTIISVNSTFYQIFWMIQLLLNDKKEPKAIYVAYRTTFYLSLRSIL